MQAFVYRTETSGRDILGTGRVTPAYKTYANLQRYYLNKFLAPGTYRVYVYYNWDNRYKESDATYEITIPEKQED